MTVRDILWLVAGGILGVAITIALVPRRAADPPRQLPPTQTTQTSPAEPPSCKEDVLRYYEAVNRYASWARKLGSERASISDQDWQMHLVRLVRAERARAESEARITYDRLISSCMEQLAREQRALGGFLVISLHEAYLTASQVFSFAEFRKTLRAEPVALDNHLRHADAIAREYFQQGAQQKDD